MALPSVDSVVHRLNNWLMLIESFNYYFSYIACLFEIHVVYSGLHLNNKVSRSQMLLTIRLKDLRTPQFLFCRVTLASLLAQPLFNEFSDT